MEVICDVAWRVSDKKGILWTQQYCRESVVRAKFPMSIRLRTDQLQMWQIINVPENISTLRPLSQASGHSKNRMASRRQWEPCLGLPALSIKTHKHDQPEDKPLWIAHQVKCALQPSSLENGVCISNISRETHLGLAGHIEGTRSNMAYLGLTPWMDHGPKPDPKPDPKPKPTQPKPIPSV
jgi:hypothetical protein